MQYTPTEMLGHRETREKMRSWVQGLRRLAGNHSFLPAWTRSTCGLWAGDFGVHSLLSPSPLISAEPGQVQHELCSSIRTWKTHILLFGVTLSLLQSKKMITAPLPTKIVHILISGTWEHQDVSELMMLREGCLPGPRGQALRAPRGWSWEHTEEKTRWIERQGPEQRPLQTRSTGQPLEAGRGRKEPPLGSSEGAGSTDTLILDVWAPEMRENTVLFF